MTAEVGVMNSTGIGLAADSAITINSVRGTDKIFTSADKLYKLSKNAPVGIMVYGNASLINLPWETLIKNYSKKLGNKVFPKLEDYANGFFTFLTNDPATFTKMAQQDWVGRVISDYFRYLQHSFIKTLEYKFKESDEDISEVEIKRLFTKLIAEELLETQKLPELATLPKNFRDRLSTNYKKIILAVRKEVFEKIPISQITSARITELALEMISRSRVENSGLSSGVVFAGFGEDENFPSLIEYPVSGMACNYPLFRKIRKYAIGDELVGIVVPFAQIEVVKTFMDGVDPNLFSMISESIRSLFNQVSNVILNEVKKEYAQFGEKLEEVTKENLNPLVDDLISEWLLAMDESYSKPIMSMVSSLPKDELGAMAESLVNLTKFKRKISTDLETVGGPIDVAVITKGDGFVWVNRKQYFPPELNTV